jgi:hypothetical protein
MNEKQHDQEFIRAQDELLEIKRHARAVPVRSRAEEELRHLESVAYHTEALVAVLRDFGHDEAA